MREYEHVLGVDAVACGESPLGYTIGYLRTLMPALWLAGNRRSDTLDVHRVRPWLPMLWLAGNRRSDTLSCAGFVVCR